MAQRRQVAAEVVPFKWIHKGIISKSAKGFVCWLMV